MASIPPATTRFFTFRKKNILYTSPASWTSIKTLFSPSHRFSVLLHHWPRSLHPSVSFRSRMSLFDLPLRSLLGPRPPSLRSPLSSMTAQAGSDSAQPSSTTKTVRVLIKGRVQGVFYRNWTVENATQLGLRGWVRNRRDGSVEALFSGTPESVHEMKQRCRRGPPNAIVTALEVFPSDDDPGDGFERRPTV